MSWNIFRPNTGVSCTYKWVKNERFPKVLLTSFWPTLSDFGPTFGQIGHVWTMFGHFLVYQRGERGSVSIYRGQK